MTRENFLAKWRDEITDLSDAYILLDQILDEYELQLKAKDEVIARLKAVIKIYSDAIDDMLKDNA